MKFRIKLSIGILLLCALLAVGYFEGCKLMRKPVGPDTRIAIMIKSIDPRIEFWQVAQDGISVAAKEYGVQVQVTGTQSETETEKQIQILEDFISRKPDAIVLAATDYNAFVPTAEKIRKAGITLVTIDSSINSSLSQCFIATDNLEAGIKAGKKLAELVDENSEIAVVSYIKGSANAIERENGVAEGLADKKGCKVVETIYSNANEETAYTLTKKLLKERPELDGIAGLNEPSTVGAAKAIKELGLSSKIKLVGFDSSMPEIKLLEEGIISAIVVQNPFNMGYRSVEITIRLLKGEKVEKRIDTGSVLVSKDNLYTVENQKLLFPFINMQQK